MIFFREDNMDLKDLNEMDKKEQDRVNTVLKKHKSDKKN